MNIVSIVYLPCLAQTGSIICRARVCVYVHVCDRVPFRLQHVRESISVIIRPRSQNYRLLCITSSLRYHLAEISKLPHLHSLLLLRHLHPASLQVRRGRHHRVSVCPSVCLSVWVCVSVFVVVGRHHRVVHAEVSSQLVEIHVLKLRSCKNLLSTGRGPCMGTCWLPTTPVSVWLLQFFFLASFISVISLTSVLPSSELYSRSFVWQ